MRKLWSACLAALGLLAACADGGTTTGTLDVTADATTGQCVGPPSGAGRVAAAFQLRDFQPASCGYDQVYGLERFVGKPTLVSLLAGW